jgi:hypothetical protein
MPNSYPGVKITPDPGSVPATLVLVSGLATGDGYTPPPLYLEL